MRTDKTRKDFIKISLAVDTDKQTILGSKITKSRQHDTKHAKPLLRNTLRMADYYVLDRGYDSEQIHLQIRTDLHAKSIIPIRDWNADYVKGEFRKEMADSFDRKRYGQRNKVETVFSVIKRRFGDEIKSRLYRSQVKELKLKCIVYSVDRFLKKLLCRNPFFFYPMTERSKVHCLLTTLCAQKVKRQIENWRAGISGLSEQPYRS
jgi:hypothetical protein